jgi:hypothetical protein
MGKTRGTPVVLVRNKGVLRNLAEKEGSGEMTTRLTKQGLKERTQEYWKEKPGFEVYINELLGRELQAISQPNGSTRVRGAGKPVHTLALTVGESFEPLLQVICVLRPRRVVLILNQFYSGTPGYDHGRELQDLIEKLPHVPDLPQDVRPEVQDVELIELKNDSPTQVFRALLDTMRKPEAQPPDGHVNVVDITGAKKSMVVGAFLYAAHSGLPITYVDFDEYDKDWGKPYGYTCRIGEIANPYEAFRLRDWEQVRRLYESYNFRSARALLGQAGNSGTSGSGILGAMSQTIDNADDGETLYDQRDINKVQRLATLFEMYEAWENGDYTHARAIADGLTPPLPDDAIPWSVVELGDVWPSAAHISNARSAADSLLKAHMALKQGTSHPSDSLFTHPTKLLAYVRDELAKIERLIDKNEDYRSAYLRAAGLHEFLLKARLVLCWLHNALEAKPKGGSTWQSVATAFGNTERDAFASLMDESSEWKFRRALQNQEEMNVRGGNVRRSSTAPSLQPYYDNLSLDLAGAVYTDASGNTTPLFVKLRGEAIHTHLYIPRNVAEAALELVQAAVKEFETNWLEHFHPGICAQAEGKRVESPSWSRLCEICELDFLPPRLRE